MITYINIPLRVSKFLLDELDIVLHSFLFRIKRTDISSQCGQERFHELRRRASGMSSNHPGWPWRWHGADLFCNMNKYHSRGRTKQWKRLTKRTSPASTNGLVVNHSHIKALVEPSFTELIRPRMSLFTARLKYPSLKVQCFDVHNHLGTWDPRWATLVEDPWHRPSSGFHYPHSEIMFHNGDDVTFHLPAIARNTNSGILQIRNGLKLGIFSSDDCPKNALRKRNHIYSRKSYQFKGVVT